MNLSNYRLCLLFIYHKDKVEQTRKQRKTKGVGRTIVIFHTNTTKCTPTALEIGMNDIITD